MLRNLRIFQTFLVAGLLLLGLKIVHITEGVNAWAVTSAHAEDAVQEENPGDTEAAKEGTGDSSSKDDPASGKEQPESGSGGGAAQAGEPAGNAEAEKPEKEEPEFSVSKVEVLRNLAARREELNKLRSEIDMRERLLLAAERKVEARILTLQALEKKVESIFGKHDEETQTKLDSLVKIYESMKPKEAARIFEKLDMGILLQVVRGMSEKKMAPILAKMDPVSAQELTVELASVHEVPEEMRQELSEGTGN